MKIQVFIPMIALLAGGCATTKDGMLLGAGIGFGTGAVSGQAIAGGDDRFKGAIVGSLVGAGVGTLIGYLTSDKDKKKPNASHVKQPEDEIPLLTKPSIRRTWVDDRIEGDKYIKGHYIYTIDQKSNWSEQ